VHSAMRGVLGLADSLIVVSSASVDGAGSASATLDWLVAHGYGALVERSVTVISFVHPGANVVDLAQLEKHFAARSRAVVRIPFDPHLEAGAELDLEHLRPATRQAWLTLAASVAEDLSRQPDDQPDDQSNRVRTVATSAPIDAVSSSTLSKRWTSRIRATTSKPTWSP
jgi:MinD-like ATPase involved in chromosome partitioning or flagellar assembly